MNWLAGKKTYILMVGVVVAAVVSFANGATDLAGMVNEILMGLGLGALRAGVGSK